MHTRFLCITKSHLRIANNSINSFIRLFSNVPLERQKYYQINEQPLSDLYGSLEERKNRIRNYSASESSFSYKDFITSNKSDHDHMVNLAEILNGSQKRELKLHSNYNNASNFILRLANQSLPITKEMIQEIQGKLLDGLKKRSVRQYGENNQVEYRSTPLVSVKSICELASFTTSEEVTEQMSELLEWIKEKCETKRLHPISIAAIAYYNIIRIYPFEDGCIHLARLLMSLILLRNDYPPLSFLQDISTDSFWDLIFYNQASFCANAGDLSPFVRIVAETTEKAQKAVEKAIQYNNK